MARRGELEPGTRFHRLTVIERAGVDAKRNRVWACACECGKTVTVAGYRLRSGETKSCGCLQREVVVARNMTHGQTGSRLYHVWANMLARCGNAKNTQYRDYGGRGIAVCSQWHKYEPFAKWALENGYDGSLTIDRIDNDSGYSPGNCRWVSRFQQSRNKRPRYDQKLTDTQVGMIRGDARVQSEIAAEYGVSQQTISSIKRGIRRTFATGA